MSEERERNGGPLLPCLDLSVLIFVLFFFLFFFLLQARLFLVHLGSVVQQRYSGGQVSATAFSKFTISIK